MIIIILMLSLLYINNNGDTMTDDQLSIVLNELFFDFEDNIFVNDGVWPRKANLIFAFADYIEAMTNAEIAYYLETENPELIEKFRLTARRGIETWLKENMKTLMM